MNGMGVLLKGMGIDVEDILLHARGIGEAFTAIRAGQDRCERMLSAICDRLEIPRELSPAELEIVTTQTRLLLDGQDSPEGGLARSSRVAGGTQSDLPSRTLP
jgi:hypothetical protein